MKSFLNLQFKRLMRVFPFAFTVAVVLFVSLVIIFSGFIKMNAEDANNQAFKIGIAGDTEDKFFQMGKQALQTFDDSRFAIEFVDLTESEAEQQLEAGKISAYVVIPEGFMDDAISGEINSIKYVTSLGSVGLVSIFKNEITKVIEDMLIYSQKGVYGLEDALRDNGHKKIANKHVNQINIEYIDLIISRGELYSVEETGISEGTSLPEYLLCGITILFLLIIGLPYAGVFVKKDMAFCRVISAKGYSYKRQIFSEAFSFTIVNWLAAVVLAFIAIVALLLNPEILPDGGIGILDIILFLIQLVPIVVLTTSLCCMLFEFTSDIVSAALLQFFVSVSMCYISGCLYPIYTFPVIVQKIAPFLPTGAAREYLQGCISTEFSYTGFAIIILYSVLFFTITMLMRKYRISKRS